MLQQILAEMYIAPELLAELSEEQKQILFLKMRQEQVRRWKEREAATDKNSAKKATQRKALGKSVKWKLGMDSEVWVWVMGEHASDKPYDVICEEIQARRAQQEAGEARGSQTFLEPAVPCSLQSQPGALGGADAKRKEEKNGEREKEDVITADKEERSWDHAQAAPSKGRDVHQMLADSKAQTKKYDVQQGKDLSRRRPGGMRASAEGELPTNSDRKEAQESGQKSDKDDPEWQESLRKSKAADERRRSIAKQARDDYNRLSLQGIRKGKVAEVAKNFGSKERSLPPRPSLPPKPKTLNSGIANGRPNRNLGVQRTLSTSTQESIIRWFKEEQFPLRAGYEKSTDRIAPWFHGILTLRQAEELLSKSEPGSFLVRVSEKIKGYALCHLSPEGCKHFLIDASSSAYSFLGVDQLQHATLADLVNYHKEEPITSLGKELLLYPCGQQGPEPDYLDLFE
ncbi:SH2 domain-containing protein 4A [Trachemys scripta elegans]|uniref:SH2 domain-containing protein 4A n=1 Tax=Trachemys scripta elegans TaxID=31138 RepID=UPI0015579F3B|nr:SH2 domain-containing protein 4A [Trachemys scripta elegans]XP_034627298.1 SH2 domain-containing protein 4A [Trachemys scripta elegans]